MSVIPSSNRFDAPESEQELFYQWSLDPLLWLREAFRVPINPDPWQAQVLIDLEKNDKVSVKSGHGVGKSTVDSWAILWFLTTRIPCKVPCTAPTLHQLRDVLWAELAVWHSRLILPLQEQIALRSSDQDMRIFWRAIPNEAFGCARTGRRESPEALQGFHSENLLFVIDECSGVDESVFEVAQGALSTEGAKVLMTSNPTRTTGTFHSSQTTLKDRYKTHTVSCLDSPRVSKQYADDVAAVYGNDSNVYRVRVLGLFPTSEDDVVIPLYLLEDAIDRDVGVKDWYRPVWGLDVARFGDDRSALAKRQGNHMLEPVSSWHGADTMETVGRVVEAYRYAEEWERPAQIVVDVIGIGAGVADRLRELGLPVRCENVGEAATSPRYNRRRDELWWLCREWFMGLDVKISDDDETIAELSDVKYKLTSSGKIQIETKDEMKKRGRRSPDNADAVVLTFGSGSIIYDEDWERMDRYEKAARKARRYKRNWRTV